MLTILGAFWMSGLWIINPYYQPPAVHRGTVSIGVGITGTGDIVAAISVTV